MRKTIALLLCSMISMLSLSAQSSDSFVNLATVKLHKTEIINLKLYKEKKAELEKAAGRALTSKDEEELFDSIIQNILLKQAAEKAGLKITEDMIMKTLVQQAGGQLTEEQIITQVEKQYGVTWAAYVKSASESMLVQQYILQQGQEDFQALSKPTEAEIKQVYDAYSERFMHPDMLRISHVYISTMGKTDEEITEARKKADNMVIRLNGGDVSFDDLVQNESEDRGSAPKGGDLGYLIRNDQNVIRRFGQGFVSAAFDVPPGKTSGVVQSNMGFHILKVTEFRSKRFLELTDPAYPGQKPTVADVIINEIVKQKQQKALISVMERVTSELKEQADIKVFDQFLPWKENGE